MSHIARTDKDEFQPSSNQDRWRLTPDAITSLKSGERARTRFGRGRRRHAAGRFCRVPLTTTDECAEPGVSADDEAKLLRWYEKQIPLLVGRTGDTKAPRPLRRNRKVAATATILVKRFYLSHSMLEREPLAHTLAAVFFAAKTEDEFVSAGELAAAVVESSDEVQRLAFRASKAEQAILSGVGYDLRVAHPHGPARALVDGVEDVEVSRIEDECDKLLTTDAPLLYAPSLLAAVACLKVGGCEEKLKEIFTPEALDEAKALASSSDPEDDAAALKKIRKRLKRTALWRDPPAPKKRPASSEEAYVPEGGRLGGAGGGARGGAAPLPRDFCGGRVRFRGAAGRPASVLAAVRGEAAPPTMFSLCWLCD